MKLFWTIISFLLLGSIFMELAEVAFIILSIAAALQGVFLVKQQYLWEEDVQVHIIGYVHYVARVLLQVYFVYLIIFKFEDIKTLLCTLGSCQQVSSKPKVIMCVAFLLVTSIILAIMYSFTLTIGNQEKEEYDIEDLLTLRASELTEDFRIWSKENRDNQTDQIAEEFSGNVTNPKEVGMGIAGFFIQITEYAYGFGIRDVCLAVALSVYSLSIDFVGLLNIDVMPTEQECQIIWRFYKSLRLVSNVTDKAFGVFLQILHVDNIFFFAYFCFFNLLRGKYFYIALLRALVLTKVTYFYLTAARTSTVNSKFRAWIQKHFNGPNTLFVENSQYVSTASVLNQIETDPIGIGSSLFYIDYSFIWKLATYVSSAVCILVERLSD